MTCTTPIKRLHIGDRIGHLVVIGKKQEFPYPKRHIYGYLCRCDCGREKLIREYELKYRKIRSCGCQQHAGIRARGRRGINPAEIEFVKKYTS